MGSPVVEGTAPIYPETTSSQAGNQTNIQNQTTQQQTSQTLQTTVVDKTSLAMNGPMTVGPTHLFPTGNPDKPQQEALAVTPARLASGHTVHFFTPLGPETASYALLNSQQNLVDQGQSLQQIPSTTVSENEIAKPEPKKSRFQVTKVLQNDQYKGILLC